MGENHTSFWIPSTQAFKNTKNIKKLHPRLFAMYCLVVKVSQSQKCNFSELQPSMFTHLKQSLNDIQSFPKYFSQCRLNVPWSCSSLSSDYRGSLDAQILDSSSNIRWKLPHYWYYLTTFYTNIHYKIAVIINNKLLICKAKHKPLN